MVNNKRVIPAVPAKKITPEILRKAHELLDQIPLKKNNYQAKALVREVVSKELRSLQNEFDNIAEVFAKGFEQFAAILSELKTSNASMSARSQEIERRISKQERGAGTIRKSTSGHIGDNIRKSFDASLKPDNEYNVLDQNDLNKLADRLLFERENSLRKGKLEEAILLANTVSEIELCQRVSPNAYRKLYDLNIKLVSPIPIRQRQAPIGKSQRTLFEILNC